jgi:HK97 family phage portal protein
VSIIAASVSQMSLGVFRDGLEIQTPTLIKQPNMDESQRAFIKKTAWSLATTGNAYWRVYGDTAKVLEVLDPAAVTVTKESGRLKYFYGAKELKASEIKHLRLEQNPSVIKSLGPIQRGQSELIGALRLTGFADEWFGSAGVPVGVLTTDQSLNGTQAQAFADAWNEFIKNNGTAVLSQGMRYEYLNIKPADAQFLEVMQAKTVAIARLFGVPATLLASGNEGTSNTYSNQQELFMQFLQTTLVDYMNEIEDALSSLLPRGQVVNFKEDGLLRMNTSLTVDVQVKQIAAGLRTPDELRAEDGLPPLPDGYEPPMSKNPNTQVGATQNGND